MINEHDLEQFVEKGISFEQINDQLECFKTGVPFLDIESAASIGNGILKLDIQEEEKVRHFWISYLKGDHKIYKFVPASGAATRMFKEIFAFADSKRVMPNTDFLIDFFKHIRHFAFFPELNETCLKHYRMSVENLEVANRYRDIVKILLQTKGMNYGSLPKSLLSFHTYPTEVRTPFEEHLVEGALYAANKNGDVHLHFTISPAHLDWYKELYMKVATKYAERLGVQFHVGFSVQKQSMDTLAVDMHNEPFRLENGKILFRPGGHGALIENLNELEADVIFIKNIDNVVPDRLKEDTVKYKKIIGGILVSMQHQIFEYLKELENPDISEAKLQIINQFVVSKLCVKCEKIGEMGRSQMIEYLFNKLNRPFRVCGMVRNEGEPGGGPYIVINKDGSVGPQILESTQIDKNDPYKISLMNNSTHFNPVDIVCGVKDYQGKKFDLTKYVDPATGFISQKSRKGIDLRALELPGLWNGAMSDWNTVFVEVPVSTFNPVKSINDLLREQHQ